MSLVGKAIRVGTCDNCKQDTDEEFLVMINHVKLCHGCYKLQAKRLFKF